MRLRPATPDDRALLEHWDEQPHVHEAAPFDDWDWEAELPRRVDWRELLIAELEGPPPRPIGFLQIIDPEREETHYWGDVPPNLRALDIWIGEADDLGQGHGARMMALALARCFAAPEVTAVVIDPLVTNERVLPFYRRLGFEFVERRRFGDDEHDCLVHRLERARWEAQGP